MREYVRPTLEPHHSRDVFHGQQTLVKAVSGTWPPSSAAAAQGGHEAQERLRKGQGHMQGLLRRRICKAGAVGRNTQWGGLGQPPTHKNNATASRQQLAQGSAQAARLEPQR